MKENSIEEDIKNAEHFIKTIKTDKEYKEENGWHGYYNKEIVELARMLEHILSDYKRVLKENEHKTEKIENQKAELATLNNKQKDFNKLQNTLKSYKGQFRRQEKENKELKEKENKIYKEVQQSLAFEKFLIVKERKPDLFNQGRFYISQIIYDILNDVQNPEGIHKKNECIQYIDYISVQKVKDKIEKIKQEKKKYGNCLIKMYEDELVNRDIKILQELIEEREKN